VLSYKMSFKQSDVSPSDGFGSKFFDPGRVSHLWFGFEIGKFLLKMSNFSIFSPWVGSKSTQVKGGLASFFLQVKSKLGSGPISSFA